MESCILVREVHPLCHPEWLLYSREHRRTRQAKSQAVSPWNLQWALGQKDSLIQVTQFPHLPSQMLPLEKVSLLLSASSTRTALSFTPGILHDKHKYLWFRFDFPQKRGIKLVVFMRKTVQSRGNAFQHGLSHKGLLRAPQGEKEGKVCWTSSSDSSWSSKNIFPNFPQYLQT